MTLKVVPVDGFVSFSLYNKEGFFFQSDSGLPSLNNVTAQKNPDNSFTVYFGGCDTRKINCLALKDGWNFVVRLYQPRKEILNGRVKTLHPKIYAGVLNKRKNKTHIKEIKLENFENIDLVIVNF